MATRSPEREQFLSDIITTAVEGGIGYWAVTLHYQWADEGALRVVVPGASYLTKRIETIAVISPTDDNDVHIIDADKIAHGLDVIHAAGFTAARSIIDGIKEANREDDAGMIDAEDADVIVQAALFGRLVYG